MLTAQKACEYADGLAVKVPRRIAAVNCAAAEAARDQDIEQPRVVKRTKSFLLRVEKATRHCLQKISKGKWACLRCQGGPGRRSIIQRMEETRCEQ
eukprot:7288734-Karenia_brevis.AAC.1